MMTEQEIKALNLRASVLCSEMDANDDENRLMQTELDTIYAKLDADKDAQGERK